MSKKPNDPGNVKTGPSSEEDDGLYAVCDCGDLFENAGTICPRCGTPAIHQRFVEIEDEFKEFRASLESLKKRPKK